MSSKTVNASSVDIIDPQERESVNADIRIDVALVLPIVEEESMSDIKIDLDYGTISKTVNDYINSNVIDSRIDKINYTLSVPDLPDSQATQNLKEALMGSVQEISSADKDIKVENDAINSPKVTKTFELSVEENVYIDSNNVNTSSVSKERKDSSMKDETNNSNVNNAGNLVVKNASPKSEWSNSTNQESNEISKSLNSENTVQANHKIILNREDTVEAIKSLGDSMDSGMGVTETKAFATTRVGDNGKIYSNPHARGNQYYKITGHISDSTAVKKLGTAGKLISAGATVTKTYDEYQKTTDDIERGKIVGVAVGEYGASWVAGTGATAATSAVLVSVAGVFGVATAPLTIIVIAGCAIVAGALARNAAATPGRNIREKAGEKIMQTWKNTSQKTNK